MWQFEYPWLFLLIPLPWLAYRWQAEYRDARSALRVPFFNAMTQAVGHAPGSTGTEGRWQLPLNLVVWMLILVACARPVLVEKPLVREQPMRDLMLALDISQSMQTQDYAAPDGRLMDRLSAVKAVVREFIAQRKDDRIGLIVFGTGAYTQAPLTLDHASLLLLLEETRIGMAGPNTALGDAIGLTIKLLDQAHEQEKVLILLTDGNDTGSAISPSHAAKMARERSIVIHTIGIGDPQGSGEAKVDLQTLQTIARTTRGRAFEARDRDALQQVYATLDRITPHQVKTFTHQPKRDLFWMPLGLALALLAVCQLLAMLRGQIASRIPNRAQAEA
jgi:Ca-activated chloride channel family protein